MRRRQPTDQMRGLTRRDVLLAGAALCLPGLVGAMAQRPEQLPQRLIPGTTEKLPVIGLGSTKPVRMIATAGTQPLESVLATLMNYGGTVVDTAPRPAELDAAFGRVLQQPDFGDALWIAAKVNATGQEAAIAQVRQSQRLFGRETFDLLQIESLTELKTNWPILQASKAAGDARYIGVTVANERLYPELELFMRRESPDFVQINYSIVEHTAEERLLPLAEELGIAILVNGPFMNGDYFNLVRDKSLPAWAREFDCESWAQFSLKYILAHQAVTCVLTETTRPQHMQDNIGAGFGRLPDATARRRMRALLRS